MVDIRLFLSKLVGAKKKIRVSLPHKIFARLKLTMIALILFGLSYVNVSKTVLALEFAQEPSVFVP